MNVVDSQSEFTMNLLMLIVKVALQGGYELIKNLGIHSDQVDALRSLNTHELQQIALIAKTNFITLKVDTKALESAITISQQRSHEHQLVLDLLRGGASRRVMRQLFGITSKEVTDMRNFLNIRDIENGRPALLNDQEQHTLWHDWLELRDAIDYSLAEILLTLHQRTHIKINSIWPFLETWSDNHKRMVN